MSINLQIKTMKVKGHNHLYFTGTLNDKSVHFDAYDKHYDETIDFYHPNKIVKVEFGKNSEPEIVYFADGTSMNRKEIDKSDKAIDELPGIGNWGLKDTIEEIFWYLGWEIDKNVNYGGKITDFFEFDNPDDVKYFIKNKTDNK